MELTDRMPPTIYLYANEHGQADLWGHYQKIPPDGRHWVYVREDVYEKVVNELAELKVSCG